MAKFWRGIRHIGGHFLNASSDQADWFSRLTFWLPCSLAAGVSYVFIRVFGFSLDSFAVPFGLAIFFLIATAFWRSFERCAQAEDRITEIKNAIPKLRVSCGPLIDGCVKANQWNGGSNLFYRAVVESIGRSPIQNCRASLVRIEKVGIPVPRWSGESAVLTFAPGERDDAEAKTIHANKPEYLDIIEFIFGNLLNFLGLKPGTKDRQWVWMPRLETIFDTHGEYILTIQFIADGMPEAHTEKFRFIYTGDFKTTEMHLITPPLSTPDKNSP